MSPTSPGRSSRDRRAEYPATGADTATRSSRALRMMVCHPPPERPVTPSRERPAPGRNGTKIFRLERRIDPLTRPAVENHVVENMLADTLGLGAPLGRRRWDLQRRRFEIEILAQLEGNYVRRLQCRFQQPLHLAG